MSSRPFRRRPDDRRFTQRALAAIQLAVVVVVAAMVIVPAAFYVMPMPSNADGATLCLPVIGPLRQYARGLSGEYEELVHVHEEIHARQCRALGAGVYARRYLDPEGRMELEAEAYCAEIDFQASRRPGVGGRYWPVSHPEGDPERMTRETVQILYHQYQEEELLPYERVAEIVDAACRRVAARP